MLPGAIHYEGVLSHSPNFLRRSGSAPPIPNFFGILHRLIGAGRSGRGQGLREYAPPRVSISH